MPLPLLPDLTLALLALLVFILDLALPVRRAAAACYHSTWIGLLVVAVLQVACTWPAGEPVATALGNYRLRPWTVPFRLVTVLAALSTVVLLHSFFNKRIKRDIIKAPGVTLLLILIVTLGSFVLASASEMITFVIGLEMATIPLYALASFSRDRIGAEASVKYLLIGGLSTAFMLFGCSYLYGAAGSLHFADLATRLPADSPLTGIGMLMVVIAIAFKLSAVPFHMWAPDIYAGAPAAITALIASGSKAAGVMGLLLLLQEPLAPVADQLDGLFILLAVASLVIGNLGALRQRHLNRFMAYSSIAQVGFVLLAFLGDSLTLPAIGFYLLVYLLGNTIAFLVFNIIAERRDETMTSLHGLSRQSPLLALCLLLAMFSLAGIPPLGGFLGKFQLVLAAAEAHHYALVLFATINAVVALYYYMDIIRQSYVVEPQADCQDLAISFPQRMTLLLVTASLLILGLWSTPHDWIARMTG